MPRIVWIAARLSRRDSNYRRVPSKRLKTALSRPRRASQLIGLEREIRNTRETNEIRCCLTFKRTR